jgi:hypothetical protein
VLEMFKVLEGWEAGRLKTLKDLKGWKVRVGK